MCNKNIILVPKKGAKKLIAFVIDTKVNIKFMIPKYLI